MTNLHASEAETEGIEAIGEGIQTPAAHALALMQDTSGKTAKFLADAILGESAFPGEIPAMAEIPVETIH